MKSNRDYAKDIVYGLTMSISRYMKNKEIPPTQENFKKEVHKWVDEVEKIVDEIREPTKEQYLKCYFDGSASPNPGPMSYGYVITDQDDRILLKKRKEIHDGTNNQAEYHGLIALCLELLGDPRFVLNRCFIYGDSQLVVKQVNGEWKAKQPQLESMCSTVKSLMNGLNCELRWIPRIDNSIADQLSKRLK